MANGRFQAGGAEDSLAYIRPHELRIERVAREGSIPATVRRVLEFGALSRIELSGAGQSFEVELPQSERAALTLAAGDAVFLAPHRLQVFAATGLEYEI